MSNTVSVYKIDELLRGDNVGIIVQTNKGTDVLIQVEHGKTLVLFPLGNLLETPESNGHLSTGVVALEVSRKREQS